MKQETRNSIVGAFFAVILSVFLFAILIVIGDYLGFDWNLLYQGEGVPLIGNLLAIGIPAYLGAHWSQKV